MEKVRLIFWMDHPILGSGMKTICRVRARLYIRIWMNMKVNSKMGKQMGKENMFRLKAKSMRGIGLMIYLMVKVSKP